MQVLQTIFARQEFHSEDRSFRPTWLRKTPEPIGQQSRWLEQLEEFFSFTVEHRSGSKHTNADAMFRRPCQQCGKVNDGEESDEVSVKDIRTVKATPNTNEVDGWASEVLAKAQREDLQLKEFHKLKEEFGNEKPDIDRMIGKDEACKTLLNQWDRIYLQDAVLYRAPWQINEYDEPAKQIIVPTKLRDALMEMAHTGMTGCHLGFEKTKEHCEEERIGLGIPEASSATATNVKRVLDTREDRRRNRVHWNQ